MLDLHDQTVSASAPPDQMPKVIIASRQGRAEPRHPARRRYIAPHVMPTWVDERFIAAAVRDGVPAMLCCANVTHALAVMRHLLLSSGRLEIGEMAS